MLMRSSFWWDMLQNVSQVQIVHIDDSNVDQRVDNFLLSKLKGVPKSRIYRLLRKGEVRVNKGRIRPHYKLSYGDEVRIPPVRISARVSEKPCLPITNGRLASLLEMAIVYEDRHLLVVNKPSGLAVHGGSGISFGLIEYLRKMRPQQHFLELVHRLDRETSGCVMVAKQRSALRHLQEQLRHGEMTKTYHALVVGRWPQRCRSVNQPLIKNQLLSGERIVKTALAGLPGVKSSLTEYRVLKCYQQASLVEAKPITGRTHQIRVHCQSAGHPIVGDTKYGNEVVDKEFRAMGLNRMFLHAFRLEFTLPNTDQAPALVADNKVIIEAPLGDDLIAICKQLTML
jgi:23S rRNA pseudouridine955/2504/2580 synthase